MKFILLLVIFYRLTFSTEEQASTLDGLKEKYISVEPSLKEETAIPLNISAVVDVKHPCPFIAEVCLIEAPEIRLVEKYIKPNDTVLEVGARFGTTSCAIAAKLKNSGRHVAVEPDSSVWEALEKNRKDHKCHFTIFKGLLVHRSGASYSVIQQGYGTRLIPKQDPISNSNNNDLEKTGKYDSSPALMQLTINQLEHLVHLKFDVLLIDCEGCINELLPHEDSDRSSGRLAHALRHVHTILLEGDMGINASDCKSNCVDYSKWIKQFIELGFKIARREADPLFPWIDHFVFRRNLNY